MPRFESELVITQPLLDRLTDNAKARDGSAQSEEASTRAESFRRYKESVKRDLEWLLNTRRYADVIPEALNEVSKSVFNYGLPDITSVWLQSAADRERLARILEAAIRCFEPRIANVRVTRESIDINSRMLSFRIDGLLRVDPVPEPVTFNTVLELASGEYEVK
jgi:type VI secretion system protein ImpF